MQFQQQFYTTIQNINTAVGQSDLEFYNLKKKMQHMLDIKEETQIYTHQGHQKKKHRWA